MALVITPLTTVALGSVEGEHSGLGSGVNNAVARVAGLLAVAVLGVFVYGAFSANLDSRLQSMDLPGEGRPRGDGAGNCGEDRTRRAVMLASAGLALASALVAALFVSDQRTKSASSDSTRRLGTGDEASALEAALREAQTTRAGGDQQPLTVNLT
jgi:hypothetical protein